jgi:hypothetical protein
MERKPFEEWSRDEVKEWATQFIGDTDAQKLWENEMSGKALSLAKPKHLKLCGLSMGSSLLLVDKVVEQRAGKVLTDMSHSLS